MVTLGAEPIFVDTNVLVYANVASAPLHRLAQETIQGLFESHIELWVSRQVLREFIATLTRPQTFINPQPIDLVSERVQFLEEHFHIAEDGFQVTIQLLELLRRFPTGGRQVHDANIVATMLTTNVYRLLTHNTKDFERFGEVITVLPLEINSRSFES